MGIEDSQSWKALGAAMKGRFEDWRSAISLGADLGVADSFGRTACLEASERCAKILLDAGCRMERAAAAWNGEIDCLRALVELGADLHARDPAGNDCLWWAAAGGSASCCEMLAPLPWPWPLMAAMDPAMAAREQGHMDLHRWLVEFDQAKRRRQELASSIDRAEAQQALLRL